MAFRIRKNQRIPTSGLKTRVVEVVFSPHQSREFKGVGVEHDASLRSVPNSVHVRSSMYLHSDWSLSTPGHVCELQDGVVFPQFLSKSAFQLMCGTQWAESSNGPDTSYPWSNMPFAARIQISLQSDMFASTKGACTPKQRLP